MFSSLQSRLRLNTIFYLVTTDHVVTSYVHSRNKAFDQLLKVIRKVGCLTPAAAVQGADIQAVLFISIGNSARELIFSHCNQA